MDTGEKILKAEKSLLTAILDKDLPLLNSLFDEEYVFTNTRGETWGKEKAMADFRDPGFSIQELSVSELEVSVNQDTAIVTGISHIERISSDNSLTGDYRLTRTWRLCDGGWSVASAQTSSIDY